MPFEFIEPLDSSLIAFAESLSPQSLGQKIAMHEKGSFPELHPSSIVLIGVPDNRGRDNTIEAVSLTTIRKQFYALYPGNWDRSIADIGNIPNGNTVQDTYYIVKTLIDTLVKESILPVIVGGSQDITYAMYRGYDKLEQMVNVVSIDSRFDFGKENEDIGSNSYITRMIVDEPNNLFNYSNIGYQTYFNSQEEIDLLEKLYFDAYRLGDVMSEPAIAEPVLRDADIVSIDMESVKSSDSGNNVNFSPNGLNGKEICTLVRYAGISDKVTSFGIFNQNGTDREALLIAQIIWYFAEGFNYRSNEYPYNTKDDYLKYIVPFEDEELIFYKSNKSERWWLELPIVATGNNKLKKNTLLPCTHNDYIGACNNKFPERLWKAQRKNII